MFCLSTDHFLTFREPTEVYNDINLKSGTLLPPSTQRVLACIIVAQNLFHVNDQCDVVFLHHDSFSVAYSIRLPLRPATHVNESLRELSAQDFCSNKVQLLTCYWSFLHKATQSTSCFSFSVRLDAFTQLVDNQQSTAEAPEKHHESIFSSA